MLNQKMNSTRHYCILCNKEYTRKSSLEKHKILCEYKTKSKREHKIEEEELGDVPTHFQLVKIVQELTLKYVKMEEKLEEYGTVLREIINDQAFIVAKVGERWKIFANANHK
jgi:hypothetical protein